MTHFMASCFVFMSHLYATVPIEVTRSTVKEWIAVEKTISAEATEWSEKEILLKDLLNVTEAEIKVLESSISELAANRTEADKTRRKLLLEQEQLSEHHALVPTCLETVEPELQALRQQLPQPLVEKLVPFYQKLPENPRQTSLGIAQRMQTVIGILTAIQQFDRTITVSDELRALDNNGTQGEVRSVYIGLGAAYYYRVSGQDAGIGYPGDQGWVWESQPSLRTEIEEVIAIAGQSTAEARFVALPVSVRN